ncbi:MAG: SAM hydroxide adenosyltransferase [Gammaproteobacteria bacterium]
MRFNDLPNELAEIIYVDHYGNAKRRGCALIVLVVRRGLYAMGIWSAPRDFATVPTGTAFWYRNSNGYQEISVNQGHAAAMLGLCIGTPTQVEQ